jgi:cobalt-zinc-cadmium efflux system outer membrane protein
LDYNLAVVELGRSRAVAMSARRERAQGDIELRRLVGVADQIPLQPIVDSSQHPAPADSARVIPRDLVSLVGQASALDVDTLTALALARRSDLTSSAAAIALSTAGVGLARREALPNILARVTSEARSDRPGRVARLGVGLTLPVFNRNQGEIDARRAAVTQSTLMRNALITRVRAEVATAVMTYRSAAAEVEVLESTVLAPARQNRQLLETAYREGKVGLPVLLLIRNQVISAELEYWTAWLEEREAFAALAEATGANMLRDDALPEVRR